MHRDDYILCADCDHQMRGAGMRHANATMAPTPLRAMTALIGCAALVITALAGAQSAAALDPATLIAGLARTPPASIAFVEARFSELLEQPVVVSGTLLFAGAGAVERRVEQPYREITTISGETVRVERAGDGDRAFTLRRAAELRGLLMAMTGLLTGDRTVIEQHFSIAPSGDEAHWQLALQPIDRRIGERLRSITVIGAGAEAHCFVIDDTRGGASILLLGDTATRPLPQPLERASLLESCAAE
jgi:hypothetical protein